MNLVNINFLSLNGFFYIIIVVIYSITYNIINQKYNLWGILKDHNRIILIFYSKAMILFIRRLPFVWEAKFWDYA